MQKAQKEQEEKAKREEEERQLQREREKEEEDARRRERERLEELERKAAEEEAEKAKRLSFEITKKLNIGLADPAKNVLLKYAHAKDPVREAAKEIAASLANFLPLPTPPQSTALLPLPGFKPTLGVSRTGVPIFGGQKLPPLPTMLISRNDVSAGLVNVGGRLVPKSHLQQSQQKGQDSSLKYPKFLPKAASVNNNNVKRGSRRRSRSRGRERSRRRRKSSRSSAGSRSRSRRSRSRSSYSRSSRSRSRSRSASIPRRTGSPSFKDKRRITR